MSPSRGMGARPPSFSLREAPKQESQRSRRRLLRFRQHRFRQKEMTQKRLPPLGASFHLSAQRYRLLLRPLFAFTVATASTLNRTSSSMTFHLSVSIMSIILSQMSLLLWMMASYHTRPCPARERRQEIQAARPNVGFAPQSLSKCSIPFSCAASSSTRTRRGRYAAISALAGCPASTMRV